MLSDFMNIGVDIRPLLEKERSGVGEYVYQLLNAIFCNSVEHQYFLFCNSFKRVDNLLPEEWRALPNVHFCEFYWPNKIFNFCLKFLKWPKIDRLMLLRESVSWRRRSNPMDYKIDEIATLPSVVCNDKLDVFFIPNLNFISLSLGVKKIITVHDLSFERYPSFFSWKRRLWHWLVNPRKLICSCDKIITVSENTKRDLVELYGVPQEKVKVIYSGVTPLPNLRRSPKTHTESFGSLPQGERGLEEVKEKYNLPENFILFLGRLEPRKNIQGLIQAFEILKQNWKSEIENLKLLIVGPRGWMCKKILARAAKSSAAKDIKFINYIKPEEKFAFYKLAKLFVYPSFYEGFGFPSLEAAAAGVPVVVSANSSFPEVMGEAAMMVDPDNPAEMAKVMEQCLVDGNLRNILIEKGKKQAAKFSWEDCTKETLKLLHS